MRNLFPTTFALLVAAFDIAAADVQPYKDVSVWGDISKLSATCINVLQQNITCDAILSYAGDAGSFFSADQLAALCTTTCSTAIDNFARRTSGACVDSVIVTPRGQSIRAAYLGVSIKSAFKGKCLQAGGKYCNAVLGDATSSADPSVLKNIGCSDCWLAMMKNTLEDPISYDPALVPKYTALTSSCARTDLPPLTTPTATTQWVTQPPPAVPTGTCDGTKYSVQAGDTCQSISKSQSISTLLLLSNNNLRAACLDFPLAAGTQLCIPKSSQCQTATIPVGAKGDLVCKGIAMAHNITYTQFISYNTDIDRYCSNIQQLGGMEACISNPGGDWKNIPPPGDVPTPGGPDDNTPTTTFLPGATMVGGSFGDLPTPTFTPTASAVPDIPFANGTRQDCYVYTGPKDSGALCDAVASSYNVTLDNFLLWNKGLTSTGACTLQDGFRYCTDLFNTGGASGNSTTTPGSVTEDDGSQYTKLPSVSPPGPTASGTTNYCREFQTAWADGDCTDFISWFGVRVDNFVRWNPTAGSASSCKLTKGISYCTSAFGMQAPGTIAICNRWRLASTNDPTTYPSDCNDIEWMNGISHARFVAWNPSLKSDCSGILDGNAYCVGIPNYKPVYSSSTDIQPAAPTPSSINANMNMLKADSLTASGLSSTSTAAASKSSLSSSLSGGTLARMASVTQPTTTKSP